MDNKNNIYEDLATCSHCRCTFDTCKEGFVHSETRQHLCPACYRNLYESTGFVRKAGNILLTLIGGFLIFFGVVSIIIKNYSFGILVIAFGLAFFAWKYVPEFKKKQEAKKWQSIVRKRESQVVYWQCSRCGANTCGDHCEYCDSPYSEARTK